MTIINSINQTLNYLNRNAITATHEPFSSTVSTSNIIIDFSQNYILNSNTGEIILQVGKGEDLMDYLEYMDAIHYSLN